MPKAISSISRLEKFSVIIKNVYKTYFNLNHVEFVLNTCDIKHERLIFKYVMSHVKTWHLLLK